MTRSTGWAAVSAIRRPPQDGHMPRDLQENATTRSSLQVLQAIRSKPRASTPAIEERSKLLLDEARNPPLVILLGRQKRFQLLGHHPVKQRLLRIARPIYGIHGAELYDWNSDPAERRDLA